MKKRRIFESNDTLSRRKRVGGRGGAAGIGEKLQKK